MNSSVTIGGDRLGAGQKEKVYLKHYNRSTHDRSYLWRSSMSAGTLVPFMSELFTPGASGEIELNCEVMTLPTVGPLFGSYKVQLDVFQVPMRLFIGDLQYNKLNVGLSMEDVKIPQIELDGFYKAFGTGAPTTEQVNPSCIMRYLGVPGLGRKDGVDNFQREVNAIPLLAYYSIFKNYYANLQEERGFVIHNDLTDRTITTTGARYMSGSAGVGSNMYETPLTISGALSEQDYFEVDHDGGTAPIINPVFVVWTYGGIVENLSFEDLFNTITYEDGIVRGTNPKGKFMSITSGTLEVVEQILTEGEQEITPKLVEFDLSTIDTQEAKVLDQDFTGTLTENGSSTPAGGLIRKLLKHDGTNRVSSLQKNQEGLLVKTYQSDLNNNWISTEWLDGENGVNALSSVVVSDGKFSVDSLNLAEKVYNMLNRIAVSGGSYDDWLDAVYTHERSKAVHSPQYLGSLIKELAFQEVISTAESGTEELGTLAGRGKLTGKHKGGKIKFKVDEPSYVIGIVSLTPRIDYSHSFKWDMDLKNFGQLHAPALDGIGYQDLLAQQMHFLGTTVNTDGSLSYETVGKQPAWINYMSNLNKTYGNFADYDENVGQAWMTLNRRYEIGDDGTIQDLTTYIDPQKFNHIFASTRLDSQNFWVQISNRMITRQKMSAKQIPNL